MAARVTSSCSAVQLPLRPGRVHRQGGRCDADLVTQTCSDVWFSAINHRTVVRTTVIEFLPAPKDCRSVAVPLALHQLRQCEQLLAPPQKILGGDKAPAEAPGGIVLLGTKERGSTYLTGQRGPARR